ncbi:hypothetical protein [Brumicola nitratireducens]|uniref:Uncharacterized protein n=1 Tax=Glaciecola nitratireducens (strain JCM 12485 / KCTC 12276 / FR1064) TaxID=1085623 RepID=G4QK48_GLANF|nr:hypothetical protein [Glaciecola nitratireducens]AEP29170.1 hypothetical protein GNIT_1033 [Glaciecola nitratireducens FR1064]
MPRMTDRLSERFNESYASKKTAFIKKRFALLSFFDRCFYSLAFGVLLISPVNAAHAYSVEQEANVVHSSDINIYAAHLTEELETYCETDTTIRCELNVLSQPRLLAALQQIDTKSNVIKALESSEYELLIGSATIKNTENSVQKLVLEVTAQWHGIVIDDIQLTAVLDINMASVADTISETSNRLLSEWVESALSKQLFSAEFLYQFLGASDYKNELKVPQQIGDFALSRQHLFNDPLKGMLSRYIHKDFDLAVFDVYVYPLKNDDSAVTQSRDELLREQQDILTISKALGKEALTMSEIYELDNLASLTDVRVFGFEATLQTNSEPLFATQYAYVKNDKVVKFSINVPARITKSLIADAINAIVVPPESSMMKQVRQTNHSQSNANLVSMAP